MIALGGVRASAASSYHINLRACKGVVTRTASGNHQQRGNYIIPAASGILGQFGSGQKQEGNSTAVSLRAEFFHTATAGMISSDTAIDPTVPTDFMF